MAAACRLPERKNRGVAGMEAIILGCGRMGRVRAAALRSLGVSIAGLYDPDEARASDLAAIVGAERVISEPSGAWPEADLAFVCTPPDNHCRLALRAVAAGMATFVEKPLALFFEEGRLLADAVERLDGICVVGHMNRIRPSVLSLQQQLAAVTPFAVDAHWMGSAYGVPWWSDLARSGGGFHEQGVHIVDLLIFLLGPIREVVALGAPCGSTEDPEAVATTLLFENGCLATVCYSYLSAERTIEVRFFSSTCIARLSGWSFDLLSPMGEVSGNGGEADRNWVFHQETRLFVEGVESRSLNLALATITSALKTQRVMDAIRRAYRTRTAVVIRADT
jgi:myo-inositol 2-dehydrogenase/D-chiro-inositol 1-dehydrogenase